jgi:hypothetical protein
MTETTELRDTETFICMLLHEMGPMSLKAISKVLGRLKSDLKVDVENKRVHPILGAMKSCVDDVPKGVTALMTKGKVERVGVHPREWRYRVRTAIQETGQASKETLEALRDYLGKMEKE